MSDTPRTDKEEQERGTQSETGLDCVYVEFAQDLERECDRLIKQCVRNVEEIGTLRAEVARLKSINVDLVPNEWTLERFAAICDIKTPEAAMVGGEQLLSLLQDAARLEWLISYGNYSLEVEMPSREITRCDDFRVESTAKQPADLREAIDAAMEEANNE